MEIVLKITISNRNPLFWMIKLGIFKKRIKISNKNTLFWMKKLGNVFEN